MEEISNTYQLVVWLLMFFLGSGGVVWKIIGDKKANNTRKKLEETLTDLSQNKEISEIKADNKQINIKLDELIIHSKSERYKKTINKDVGLIMNKFFKEKQIKRQKIQILLTYTASISRDVFAYMLDVGLSDVHIETLLPYAIGQYEVLRTDFSKNKMDNIQNFKKSVKNEIIKPELTDFIRKFELQQQIKVNGELQKAFNVIALELVRNILIQTYNLYIELRENKKSE